MVDLVVDVTAARAAETAVQAAARQCAPAGPSLGEVAAALPGSALGLAAGDLNSWAAQVSALCDRAVQHAAAARRACEALAELDQELCR